MSRQHRRSGPSERDPAQGGGPARGEPSREVEPSEERSNTEQTQELPASVLGEAAGAEEASALAEHVGLHLRVAPRDPRWTERLVEVVSRSSLPAERKEALAERLRWDQVHADDVSRAVAAAFGRDDPALRSGLIAALAAPGAGETALDRVAAALSAGAGGLQGPVRELVQSLALLELVWEEEEEAPPPGDYLAEESGW